jgi:hypothetical protein
VIAAPLRRAPNKNARGVIERVPRLRPFQSADVGGSTPRIEGWRGGSRLSKPPRKDFSTPSSVGPWATTTRWPSCEEDGAEPDGPSVERRRVLARDLDAGRRNR